MASSDLCRARMNQLCYLLAQPGFRDVPSQIRSEQVAVHRVLRKSLTLRFEI